MHDLTMQYGFDEIAGNFQAINFGKGGKANDSIQVTLQDPDFPNFAGFYSPRDGIPGEMILSLFNSSSPARDGALDNSIPVHEFMRWSTKQPLSVPRGIKRSV